MSKTPLFSLLRRAAQKSFILARHPRQRNQLLDQWASLATSRRNFLRISGMVTASLAVPWSQLRCGDDHNLEIVVIGAGLAGLHCAYRLQQAGFSPTVYEAANRVGGRTYTGRGLYADNQICELGGELIDTGHATLIGLAQEFGLTLDDLQESPAIRPDTFYFEGALVDEATIVNMFTPVAEKMTAAVQAGETSDEIFTNLDNTSIAEWLAAPALGDADPLLRKILNVAYTIEYGLEADQQSLWNLLYLIDYEQTSPFRIFGDSDERFHIHEGNDSITQGLAAALFRPPQLGHVLTAIKRETDSRYMLTFDHGASTKEVKADRVVLALPFSLLREVDLFDAGIRQDKLTAIKELGYGTNVKIMSGFDERVWRTQHAASGSSYADNGLQSTWESSRGQSGASGILTTYLGGDIGVAAGAGTSESVALQKLNLLEPIFPGSLGAYVPNSSVRMYWPTARFHKGSYACYKPGQWALSGLEGQREGGLYFCGEHTSVDFQGYMEGAAESGARVAREILGV